MYCKDTTLEEIHKALEAQKTRIETNIIYTAHLRALEQKIKRLRDEIRKLGEIPCA